MKIGVFDSGIGGKAMATRLGELLPNATIISVDDHEHVPYGTRSELEIVALTTTAIQPLISEGCDAIVIACNTATTVAIGALRLAHPTVNFVGIEPMIKTASTESIKKNIAVLATPATLNSARYKELKLLWASGVTVNEPDCSNWAQLIEEGRAQEVPIEAVVIDAIKQGADVIVLACTHYHLLKERAMKTAGKSARVLEPSDAIARRIKSIVAGKL